MDLVTILDRLETDNSFLNRFFSDEATFHMSVKVSRYNITICKLKILIFIRSILKIPVMRSNNVWCAISCNRFTVLFLFCQKKYCTNKNLIVDILENFVIPLL